MRYCFHSCKSIRQRKLLLGSRDLSYRKRILGRKVYTPQNFACTGCKSRVDKAPDTQHLNTFANVVENVFQLT